MAWNTKKNYLVTLVNVFPELHTRIWMRSNACCLDPTHFAKPHRKRFWSLEPFSRGVQIKSPENEKLWIDNSWVVLKFFIAKLKVQNVLFLCKMVTAWLTFAVKVYDQTRKANGIPETLSNVRFHFKSKKALFPRFSCFSSSFFPFWLGFCKAAFLQKFWLNPLVVKWRHHRDMG